MSRNDDGRIFQGTLNISPVGPTEKARLCTVCKKEPAAFIITMDTESYEGGPFSVEAELGLDCWEDQMDNITITLLKNG